MSAILSQKMPHCAPKVCIISLDAKVNHKIAAQRLSFNCFSSLFGYRATIFVKPQENSFGSKIDNSSCMI